MGSCVGRGDAKKDNVKLANKLFESIDVHGEQKLTPKNLSDFFKEYPEASVKLIMSAMDFNQDGVVTKNQWFGYWEYIRRAGYEEKAIRKTLLQLQEGTVFFNFPKAELYKSGVPRETIIQGIVTQLKDDGSLPIRLQP